MNTSIAAQNLVNRVCMGNEQARDFLVNHWQPYCHEIDDIIDGDRTTKEQILATFARAISLYSHPFYLNNLLALRQIVLNVTNTYADSVAMEHSAEDWQKQWSDHHSHVAQEMMIAIATILGGYTHARNISLEMRYLCWFEHHKPGTTERI